MSIPLLENPDKLHDLVDDLESVFWVFVYVAVKHFSAPDQVTPYRMMRMFNEEELGSQGQIVGGSRKTHCLFFGDLSTTDFTDDALEKLLSHLGSCWHMYHCARTGNVPPVDDPEVILKMLKLAPLPSYWAEQFTTALQPTSPSGTRTGADMLPQPYLARERRLRRQAPNQVPLVTVNLQEPPPQKQKETVTNNTGKKRKRRDSSAAEAGSNLEPSPYLRRSKRLKGIDKP